MDRQAFKQRMQQLKQYREQNPGKTYLDFKKYAEGGEIPPSNKPIIPEEPQPYKGKLYKDRYGRKYTEDQLADYYDNSSDEIDRFTGKPFVRGLKPVGDIEDAANATPVGDAISAYDTYKALQKDISNKKIDTNDEYYSRPTEQKAHMNQLREYMFQNNYIKTRGETVDEKLLKKAMQEAEKHDSMKGMIRASKQFKSFNKYTKWFNSIPLLGVGAAAVYNNNQE